MLWVIRPEIPLNPPNGPPTMFDHENVRRLGTINSWAVFRLNTREIEGLMPPNSHVRGGEPFLQ